MSRLDKYDAIIIGGGHNGLTAAAYLSKAGKKVLVLERRHVLGGAAVTEEVYYLLKVRLPLLIMIICLEHQTMIKIIRKYIGTLERMLRTIPGLVH